MGMTKSAFNTLWLTGGGLLATWLAVSPSNTATHDPSAISAGHLASEEISAAELAAGAARLRQHPDRTALRPSTRNPFKFAHSSSAPRPVQPPVAASAPAAPPAPVLTLSGITEQKRAGESKRTAVIFGEGQLYLVSAGDAVAGRYRVARVESDAVVLQDDAGVETRLTLH